MRKKTFIDKIYSKKTIKKINEKINLLSDDISISAKQFLYYRLIGCIIIFIFFVVTSNYSYITAPLFTIGYYCLITYLLINSKIKKRSLELEHEAIFFFEILKLSLESGKSLSSALRITSLNVSGKLSNEFQKALDEVKMGKSLIEALKNMRYRIPSDTINGIILNMIESSVFGGNIELSLINQLEYLRNKELMYIKGKISKLPMKISIISVLFLIPLILLMILSPVLINFLLK